MGSVFERVKGLVIKNLGADESSITENSSFVEDLGADSLDQVELVMAFEEEFGVEIPDEIAEKITTIRKAVDYIEQNIKVN
ncbi:MAG: acyl carrier protein [Rickettsiales bacterium]|jgi:acyl carrier protein|nr:acyl carrier protein [Rickettsiales bacterium]